MGQRSLVLDLIDLAMVVVACASTLQHLPSAASWKFALQLSSQLLGFGLQCVGLVYIGILVVLSAR